MPMTTHELYENTVPMKNRVSLPAPQISSKYFLFDALSRRLFATKPFFLAVGKDG
jgi:hypothetical protein